MFTPFSFLQHLGLYYASFLFLWIFFHIMGGMFFLQNLQCMSFKSDSSYFKTFPRVLALRRICLHWWEDISILAGTLHLLEGKYYLLLRWKIPYVSSINLKRCDISYHCSTRMFLLGNAQNILMSMFIHQRKSFFSSVKWQNYAWSNITKTQQKESVIACK